MGFKCVINSKKKYTQRTLDSSYCKKMFVVAKMSQPRTEKKLINLYYSNVYVLVHYINKSVSSWLLNEVNACVDFAKSVFGQNCPPPNSYKPIL